MTEWNHPSIEQIEEARAKSAVIYFAYYEQWSFSPARDVAAMHYIVLCEIGKTDRRVAKSVATFKEEREAVSFVDFKNEFKNKKFVDEIRHAVVFTHPSLEIETKEFLSGDLLTCARVIVDVGWKLNDKGHEHLIHLYAVRYLTRVYESDIGPERHEYDVDQDSMQYFENKDDAFHAWRCRIANPDPKMKANTGKEFDYAAHMKILLGNT